MAELTYKSAGVGTREIDLSQPSKLGPQGTPACVIGTANRGPAFVPATVGDFRSFVTRFGESDGEKFAPLAVNEWLNNAKALTFVRTLGVGDGSQAADGVVTNAGFEVGVRLPQADGNVAANPVNTGGAVGDTYILGAHMADSAGSTFLADAGLSGTVPVVRAMLMAPYGVTLGIGDDSTPTADEATAQSADSTVFIYFNTHTSSTDAPAVLEVSFDPTSQLYLSNVLNTDPLLIEEKGHLLYTHYEVDTVNAVVTAPVTPTDTVFLKTNNGATIDYKAFTQRFNHARTPWVRSQKFGASAFDLFKIHALSDGESETTNIKISIMNISYDRNGSWGSFDIAVRQFDDTDANPVQLERFSGLTLDPTSDRYIAKVVGDNNLFYNFDKNTQQLSVQGSYPNSSAYIRVEMSTAVKSSAIPVDSLPMGHEEYMSLTLTDYFTGAFSATEELPIPFRRTIAVGTALNKKAYAKLHWGVQHSVVQDLAEPNESFVQASISRNIIKFMAFGGSNSVWSTQVKNNNEFSLEKIEIAETSASDTTLDVDEWQHAEYRRDAVLDGSLDSGAITDTRFLLASDLTSTVSRNYTKFTMLMQGGFNGTNIFNEDKSKMQNPAIIREMSDATLQGGTSGPTVASYRKAIDVITSKSDVEIQLLAIPGIRNSAVTDYALDTVESRFDALFIMDIDQYDSTNSVMTGSDQVVDVGNTISNFAGVGFDSSFGAAYFPDVIMTDPIAGSSIQCPPSVAVLGAMSKNDSLAHPWFAPAGFTRGALSNVSGAAVSFSRENLDSLYENKLNPLTSFPGTEVVIWGQKTLQDASSALDRVNVRRLLIEIRRNVKNIAYGFLFEPNRSETLAKFEAQINPLLQSIQEKSGLDRYKVKIDTETTTQVDVENNTLRGKIYIQPTKTAEFISLDFVVSNTL